MAVRRPLIIDGGSIKELPSGDTLPSGGRETWISSTTISDDAAVDIELTGSYDHYLLVFDNVRPATSTTLYFRTSTDGATFDSGASHYTYAYLEYRGGSSVISMQDSASSSTIQATSLPGHESPERLHGEVKIYPSDGTRYSLISGRFSMITGSVSRAGWSEFAGSRQSTTAISHVRILMASGNLADGDVHLYGVTEGA